jgi:hypothetical protein
MGNEGHMELFEAENEFKSSMYFTLDQASAKLIDPSQDLPRPIL